MTPATDEANAPPGNSRFEAIASSTLTGRFFGVPFFRPSVSPALLFNVWAYLLGPFAFFPLRPFGAKASCSSPWACFVRPAHPAHGRLRVHGHPH